MIRTKRAAVSTLSPANRHSWVQQLGRKLARVRIEKAVRRLRRTMTLMWAVSQQQLESACESTSRERNVSHRQDGVRCDQRPATEVLAHERVPEGDLQIYADAHRKAMCDKTVTKRSSSSDWGQSCVLTMYVNLPLGAGNPLTCRGQYTICCLEQCVMATLTCSPWHRQHHHHAIIVIPRPV